MIYINLQNANNQSYATHVYKYYINQLTLGKAQIAYYICFSTTTTTNLKNTREINAKKNEKQGLVKVNISIALNRVPIKYS